MFRFRFLMLAFLPALLIVSVSATDEALAARANDNRTPAGKLRDGVLTLHLEIVETIWFRSRRVAPACM